MDVVLVILGQLGAWALCGVGLLLLHFGFAIRGILLRILGFLVGALLGVALGVLAGSEGAAVFVGVVLGIAGAFLAPLLERIIVFILGGLVVALVAVACLLGPAGLEAHPIAVGLPFFVFGGLLSVWFFRWIMMLILAKMGAALISAAWALTAYVMWRQTWDLSPGETLAFALVVVHGVLFQNWHYKQRKRGRPEWEMRHVYYVPALLFFLLTPLSSAIWSFAFIAFICRLLFGLIRRWKDRPLCAWSTRLHLIAVAGGLAMLCGLAEFLVANYLSWRWLFFDPIAVHVTPILRLFGHYDVYSDPGWAWRARIASLCLTAGFWVVAVLRMTRLTAREREVAGTGIARPDETFQDRSSPH